MTGITICATFAFAMLGGVPEKSNGAGAPARGSDAETKRPIARGATIDQIIHQLSDAELIPLLVHTDRATENAARAAALNRLSGEQPGRAGRLRVMLIAAQKATKDPALYVECAGLISVGAQHLAGPDRQVVLDHMRAGLRNPTERPDVVFTYAQRLIEMDQSKESLDAVVSVLLRAQRSESEWFERQRIISRLGVFGDTSLPVLVKFMEPDNRGRAGLASAALEGISTNPSHKAFAILAAAAQQGSHRAIALRALSHWAAGFPASSAERSKVDRLIGMYVYDVDPEVVNFANDAREYLRKSDAEKL